MKHIICVYDGTEEEKNVSIKFALDFESVRLTKKKKRNGIGIYKLEKEEVVSE